MKAAAEQDATDREPYPPLLVLPLGMLYAVATVSIIAIAVFGDDPALNSEVRAQIERQRGLTPARAAALAECLRANEAIAARNARGVDHPPLKEIPCHVPAL